MNADSSKSNSASQTFLSDRDRKALSELIELAERVQYERYKITRQIFINAFALIGITLILSLLALNTSFSNTLDVLFGIQSDALFLLVVAMGSIAFLALLYIGRRLLARETIAFSEVMAVVYEVFEGVKNKLSPLELAEIRLRISRLY